VKISAKFGYDLVKSGGAAMSNSNFQRLCCKQKILSIWVCWGFCLASFTFFVVFSTTSNAYQLSPKRYYENISVADFDKVVSSGVMENEFVIEKTFIFLSNDRQDLATQTPKNPRIALKPVYYVRFEQFCRGGFAAEQCLTAIFRGEINRDNFQGFFIAGDIFNVNDTGSHLCYTCDGIPSVTFSTITGDEYTIIFAKKNVIFRGNDPEQFDPRRRSVPNLDMIWLNPVGQQ
jgi:hypothetical protein